MEKYFFIGNIRTGDYFERSVIIDNEASGEVVVFDNIEDAQEYLVEEQLSPNRWAVCYYDGLAEHWAVTPDQVGAIL